MRVHSVVMAAASAFIRNKIQSDTSGCVSHTFHSKRLHWFPFVINGTCTEIRTENRRFHIIMTKVLFIRNEI